MRLFGVYDLDIVSSEGQLKDKVRFQGEPSLRAMAFRVGQSSIPDFHSWPCLEREPWRFFFLSASLVGVLASCPCVWCCRYRADISNARWGVFKNVIKYLWFFILIWNAYYRVDGQHAVFSIHTFIGSIMHRKIASLTVHPVVDEIQ